MLRKARLLAVLDREAVALFTFLISVNDLLLTCNFAFCEESDDVRSFFLETE